MESKVKSHISNKTYLVNLDTIEEEDKDLKSELYMLPISGNKIMVAPGKSRMDENGISFCYVYVIQKEKVVTKLGVYEKKSDSMPLIFDISTFPEGSFCLFEEFEKNPSKLLDFVMSQEKTVFDFLIEEFPKINDKKKTLKSAYKTIYETLMKEENKKDKEMKAILKVISTASKEDSPTDAFLYTLKDSVSNEKTFVYTILALQHIFNIEFSFKTDNGFYQEIVGRWSLQGAPSTIEVDVETYEIIDRSESAPEPQVGPDVDLNKITPNPEPQVGPDVDLNKITPNPEPDTKLDDSLSKQPEIDDVDEMIMNPEVDTNKVETNENDTRLDDSTPKPVDLDESLPKPVLEDIPETESVPVKKTRKARTPKSDTKPSSPKEKTKATKAKKTMDVPLGTSLNVETKITETKIKAPRKLKLKSKEESS